MAAITMRHIFTFAAWVALVSSVEARSLKQTRYFIFGYGSLLNEASTRKTNCGLSGFSEGDLNGLTALLQAGDPNGALTKFLGTCQVQGQRVVRISGLQRGSNSPVKATEAPVNPYYPNGAFNPSYTALGAYEKRGAVITGLVYEVDRTAYDATIKREREGGYAVKEIGVNGITVLGGPALPRTARIVFFASNASSLKLPTPQVPMAYSYVDVWLGGAVDLQKTFNLTGPSYRAKSGGKAEAMGACLLSVPAPPLPRPVEETIKTTESWNRYLLNDRVYPLRPFVNVRNARAIDDALWSYVPKPVLAGIRYPGSPW